MTQIEIINASKILFRQIVSRHYHYIHWKEPTKEYLIEFDEEMVEFKKYDSQFQKALQHSLITMITIHPFSLNDNIQNEMWKEAYNTVKKYILK